MNWNEINKWDVTVKLEDAGRSAWWYGANWSARKILVTLGDETQVEKLGDYYSLSGIGREPKRNPYNNISLQNVSVIEAENEQIVEVLSKTQDKQIPERKFTFRFGKK